ncbi:MAG: DUF4190 domain-containing protein [Anaerolineaceae bacterium]|jgi:hypothetical protein
MTTNSETSQPQTTSSWSIVSLVTGITSYFILPIIGAIIAIITGYVAKNEIKNSNGQIAGDGMATAGLILGWINIALCIIAVVIVILLFIGAISGFTWGGPLTNWLSHLGIY